MFSLLLCRSSKSFVSQLLASSHGLREFSLPSGEQHRLRFVQPWSPSVSVTLLKSTDSPFHVPNSKDHKQILIYTGGTTFFFTIVRFYSCSTSRESIRCVFCQFVIFSFLTNRFIDCSAVSISQVWLALCKPSLPPRNQVSFW